MSEVRGVLEPPRLTRVPAERAGLAGVAVIRGSMLPVFDLAALLGETRQLRARRLVVVEHQGGVGLLVEAAEVETELGGAEALDLLAVLAAAAAP